MTFRISIQALKMVFSGVHDVLKDVRVADIFGGDQPQLWVVVVYIAVRVLVLTPRIRYSGTTHTENCQHRPNEYYQSYSPLSDVVGSEDALYWVVYKIHAFFSSVSSSQTPNHL